MTLAQELAPAVQQPEGVSSIVAKMRAALGAQTGKRGTQEDAKAASAALEAQETQVPKAGSAAGALTPKKATSEPLQRSALKRPASAEHQGSALKRPAKSAPSPLKMERKNVTSRAYHKTLAAALLKGVKEEEAKVKARSAHERAGREWDKANA